MPLRGADPQKSRDRDSSASIWFTFAILNLEPQGEELNPAAQQ